MGAAIVAVYVIENPIDVSMGVMPVVPPALDPEWRDAMRVAFEKEWCEPLGTARVSYTTRMEEGRAATEIVRVADEVEADVVVMGRRGRGGVAELLLGSVSHEVAQHCKRPVMLISR
jgi:nucleotide-binding universal stress UspA family protein